MSEPERPVPPSRAGRAWVALVPAAIVLAVLLVFVLQNRRSTTIRFLGLDRSLPLGVALLLAGALGGLLVFLLGSVRILQRRRTARRQRR